MSEKNRAEAICFTGHRDIDFHTAVKIPSVLKSVIEGYIKRGVYRFRAGGAMGFDTVAAICVLELKPKYPHIKLELILPCRDQDKKFDEASKRAYRDILNRADHVEYIYNSYTPDCMLARNRALVDGSCACVAFCQKSAGGTGYTMAYALKSGVELININDML